MARAPVPKKVDGPQAFSEMFHVSRETLDKLATYAGLLRTWQRKINLVSSTTVDDLWHRHMADSAQLVAIALAELADDEPAPADRPRRWLDLGSGAGFPGLVVALLLDDIPATRSWHIGLVESDQRKCAFLREVVRETGLGRGAGRVKAVDILGARIEKVATRDTVESVDVVSARALASLDILLAYVRPLYSRHGVTGLFMKGRDAAAEVAVAQQRWRFDARFVPSMTDPAAAIVVVRRLQPLQEGSSQ